ncbi:GNAT family N-acetyltransferase [Lacrimispora brassicae]
MEIRKTRPTDNFNAIASIYALSWKSAYKGIVQQQYLDKLSETRWSEKLPNSPWDSFVLIEDGVYIGTSSIGPARDEAMDGWGEIISIYLLPEYLGKCYGKPLLDMVISELVIMGYHRIYLWVLEDNLRARAFYEKNGFAPTSDKMTIEIGGEDLIEMRYIYCI